MTDPAAADLFPRCLPTILAMEGGLVDHPSDPGGLTKYGISQRAYPAEDIRALTKARAGELYRRDYWEVAGCPVLGWPMALVHFDAAVNHGVRRARRFLAAAPTAEAYLAARAAFYRALVRRRPASSVFLKGWMNRLRHVAQVGQVAWSPD